MNEHHWTPVEIETLLGAYYLGDGISGRPSTPAVDAAARRLLLFGFIDSLGCTTTRGDRLVEEIKKAAAYHAGQI